jgi:hypothetical protein
LRHGINNNKLSERYSITLSCYDRLILTGSIPELSYAAGMTSYFYNKGVKIFDYPRFAEPFKDNIRANIEQKAHEQGVSIEFIRKLGIRKESIISEKIKERGSHPGIVHIISAMEGCNTYKPWHDKSTGKTFLKPDKSQCLHYYILPKYS